MKNYYVNLVPISTGGGLQNAKSFLETFVRSKYSDKGIVFFVRKGSEIEELCRNNGLGLIAIEDSHQGRLKFEFFSRNNFKKSSLCLTLFGPPPISSFKNVTNLVGCAYSNLFYPELPFWSYLPFRNRFLKESIDIARRYYTKGADFWIFETEALRRRSIELCNFPEDRVSVIKMAPSKLVAKDLVREDKLRELKHDLPESFKILYLSGAHPNKRLHLLPGIAHELVSAGISDFVFVTTFDDSSQYAKSVIKAFADKNLIDHICNLGPVKTNDVATVIEACDAMCTLSLLESFSNNFIEAWRMEKPLVVTDADWARDSCHDAALYVDPEKASGAATAISELINSSALGPSLIEAGRKQLCSYNTPESKMEQYFKLIGRAEVLGPLDNRRRNKIHWPKQGNL